MTAEVICGDCLEVMPTMEAGSFDAVLTDPPYGTEALGGGYGRHQLYEGGRYGRRIANDTDLSALESALPEMVRLCKPDAWWAVFCAPRKIPPVLELLAITGVEYYGEVIWDKGMPGLGYHIRYSHENALICRLGAPPRPAEALISVLRVSAARVSAGAEHPHRKPVPLMRRLARWVCPEGGKILDPFAGCGPVGVACASDNRNYLGIELNPEYADIARKRITETPPSLFGATE